MGKSVGLSENLLNDLEPGDQRVRGGSLLLALSLFQKPKERVQSELLNYLREVSNRTQERIKSSAWQKALGSQAAGQYLHAIQKIHVATGSGQIHDEAQLAIWNQDTVLKLLEPTALNVIRDAEKCAEMSEEISGVLEESVSKNYLNAVAQLEEAFEVSGIERGECLRNARQGMQEALADPNGSRSAIIQFLNGVSQSISSFTGGDAPQLLTHAAQIGLSGRDGLSSLANWAIGRAYLQREEKSDALVYFDKVPKRKGEFIPLLDLARLQLEAGNVNRARQTIESALESSPLAFIFMVADSAFEPEAASIAARMNGLALAAAQRIHNEMRALKEWDGLCKQVEQTIGHKLTLDTGLAVEAEATSALVSGHCSLDLIGFSLKIAKVLDIKKAEASENINRLCDAAQESISALQTEIHKFEKKKSEAVANANAILSRKMTLVRMEQRRSELEVVRAERGCAWSFEYGLIMFGVYVITLAVFAFMGNKEAYKSPLAMLIGFAGVVPIAMAILVQIGTMLRKGAAEAAISQVHKAAKSELEQKLKKIDQEFEQEAVVVNQSIASYNQKLEKLAQAKTMLEPGVAQMRAA